MRKAGFDYETRHRAKGVSQYSARSGKSETFGNSAKNRLMKRQDELIEDAGRDFGHAARIPIFFTDSP